MMRRLYQNLDLFAAALTRLLRACAPGAATEPVLLACLLVLWAALIAIAIAHDAYLLAAILVAVFIIGFPAD